MTDQKQKCCGEPVTRRQFMQLAGAGAATAATAHDALTAIAGPFQPKDVADHFVPADKKLKPAWVAGLFERGEPTWFAGDDLERIAMPIGGIATGQLYLAGDGRLTHWDLFNKHHFSGYGATNYQAMPQPAAPVRQGFAVQIKAGEKTSVRTLDRRGFPAARFRGEYPIGLVQYADNECPVTVSLEAFSPFAPLAAGDSAMPVTVMRYTLANVSSQPVEVTLAGWLENAVCRHSGEVLPGVRRNRLVRDAHMTMILGDAQPSKTPLNVRKPIVIADFEGPDYAGWTVEGEAFGAGPAQGTLAGQQPVEGFQGKGLVNTFFRGDKPQGRLTSPPFTIERSFLNFLIGGGKHRGQTCMNLLVGGRVVRTAEGQNRERLAWQSWDVRDLAGREARLEIVDRASGPWGHVNVDQIEQADLPRGSFSGPLEDQPDFGTLGLALLDSADDVLAIRALPDGPLPETLFSPAARAAADDSRAFGQALVGALGKTVALAPGAKAEMTFLVAWCFANRPERGNYYAIRHTDARAHAVYVAENFERLAGQTRLWRDTWYDSTLPWWLLDRLFSTTSILATSTCQWWANGRFWAWEGVGCCPGTCAHVWNYEHAMARLFPVLERSVREMQDFHPEAGFDEQTGAVRFRGESNKIWAGDSQGGTLLKALREHQASANDEFLKRNWRRIRKALEFLLHEDANADGLIEGSQHNTYDINFFGANTMVGSLYLGALRAGEQMARELGEMEFAETCREVFQRGSRLSVERLFNGEYFIQQVDLKEHPKHQYGEGCLSDQVFGQGWAHQVGLGDLYPADKVRAALAAVWRYNWAPDVGPQNAAHPPQRWFARPGEAGLFTCTWPKSKHLGPDSVLYRDEVWTGIEYQVAGHMVWEGMLTEALAICRGVHERYHPSKHNPYNEIECGDHYARAMASYGVFLALCGFRYHGPQRSIGWAPKITPENFRGAFTSAEAWGTLSQQREGKKQLNRLSVKWGRLPVATLTFELPEDARLASATVTLDGKPLPAKSAQDGRQVTLALKKEAMVTEGGTLEVTLGW